MRSGRFVLLAFLAGAGAEIGCGGGATGGFVGSSDAGAPTDDAAGLPFGGKPAPNPGMPGPGPLPPLMPGAEVEFLGPASGIATPVIDANADDAGNVWAVAPDALSIRMAGQSTFRKYTNSDGLHIYTVITAVAGAGRNEGYVGLMGHETDTPDADPPALKQAGKAEHVRLHPDGTIESQQYADLHVDVSANYWETRSARRLLYIHDGAAAGHLFMGGNHGITHILNDGWGDHVHVEVYYMPEHAGTYGDWYGLALDPATNGLWTCGKNACGLQTFDPDPRAWVQNGRYQYAFTVFTADHGLEVPHGNREDFVATAVAADGTAYFLSKTEGLASWNPQSGDYNRIRRVPVAGLGTPVDLVADPDGTLWIADDQKLLRFNPNTNEVKQLSLATQDIRRLYLDSGVRPRALYVSTGNGLVIYRGQ